MTKNYQDTPKMKFLGYFQFLVKKVEVCLIEKTLKAKHPFGREDWQASPVCDISDSGIHELGKVSVMDHLAEKLKFVSKMRNSDITWVWIQF
jgi:hypothetical protein